MPALIGKRTSGAVHTAKPMTGGRGEYQLLQNPNKVGRSDFSVIFENLKLLIKLIILLSKAKQLNQKYLHFLTVI